MAGILRGSVKVWKSESGYGFIKPDNGTKDVFVHVRDLKSSGVMEEPKAGDVLSFDVADGERGLHAVNLAKA